MFRFFGITALVLAMGYLATSVQLPVSSENVSSLADSTPDWRKTNRGWERAELWNQEITQTESKIPTPVIHPIPATIMIYALAMLALSSVPGLESRKRPLLSEQTMA